MQPPAQQIAEAAHDEYARGPKAEEPGPFLPERPLRVADAGCIAFARFLLRTSFGHGRHPAAMNRSVKNGSILARLGHALAGIRLVRRREKSFRTHMLCGAAALGVAAGLRVGPLWWALIVLSIAVVSALEAMNAALEYLADRLHPERHEEIGCAKDAAAGAVLLASLGSAIVGALMVLAWWRG